MASGQPPECGGPGATAWVDTQMRQLLEEHYGRIYRFVRRNGFSEVDSAEILDISAAAVYKRLVEKGPVQRSLVAYFTKVVKNQMAQRKRDRFSEPVDLVAGEVLAALPDLGPPVGRVADTRSREREAWLRAALSAVDQLPEYLREPYELEVYEGLTPKEIAHRLGKASGSIRAYLSVARAIVKKRTAELLQSGVGGREGDDE